MKQRPPPARGPPKPMPRPPLAVIQRPAPSAPFPSASEPSHKPQQQINPLIDNPYRWASVEKIATKLLSSHGASMQQI
jgi:hypothetical protein